MNYKYVDIESWDKYLNHLEKKQQFNKDDYTLLFNKDNDFDCKLDDFEVINVIGKGSLSNVTHILYFRYIWFKRKKLRSSL